MFFVCLFVNPLLLSNFRDRSLSFSFIFILWFRVNYSAELLRRGYATRCGRRWQSHSGPEHAILPPISSWQCLGCRGRELVGRPAHTRRRGQGLLDDAALRQRPPPHAQIRRRNAVTTGRRQPVHATAAWRSAAHGRRSNAESARRRRPHPSVQLRPQRVGTDPTRPIRRLDAALRRIIIQPRFFLICFKFSFSLSIVVAS